MHNQRIKSLAILAPSGSTPSIRQELLSQDCRDVMAWGFEMCGVCGFEVKSSNAEQEVCAVLFGGGESVAHYGSDSQRYFTRYSDPEWSVVMACDCNGDALRGDKIVQKYTGSGG